MCCKFDPSVQPQNCVVIWSYILQPPPTSVSSTDLQNSIKSNKHLVLRIMWSGNEAINNSSTIWAATNKINVLYKKCALLPFCYNSVFN